MNDQLQAALGEFRKSVTDWSSAESERALAKARESGWAGGAARRLWLGWPILAAAALVLGIAPVYQYRQSEAARQNAIQAQADTQLLEQVDREISEAVPTPMQPLAQLVTWDNGTQESSAGSGTEKGDVR